jgi:hypothetical protein
MASLSAASFLAAAGAGDTSASKATPSRTIHEQLKLPLPGKAIVDELDVTATAPKAGPGTLRIRTTNDSALPAGIRAAAIVARPVSKRHRATFKVYLAINNPSGPSPGATPAPGSVLDFNVYSSRGTFLSGIHLKTSDCEQLKTTGDLVDVGVMHHSYSVVPLRPTIEQPSPGEEVFDRSAFSRGEELGCLPGVVETPDPGND